MTYKVQASVKGLLTIDYSPFTIHGQEHNHLR